MIKNDVLNRYECEIEELVNTRPIPDIEDRFKKISELNERFYSETGKNLPSQYLTMLTDWVLIETLNDRDVDKVSNTEYAILSHRQLRRRDKRESSVDGDVMDYLNLKFVKKKDSLAKKVKKTCDC